MALWRTNGYAKTTVADICRAAGVSRALFYFYFPAKEDVLFEVGLLSTRAAQKTVRSLLQTDYEVDAVIANALRSLERSMARNPRDLIIETILEGYRHEHRILAGDPRTRPKPTCSVSCSRRHSRTASWPPTSTYTTCPIWRGCMSAKACATGPAGSYGDRSFAEVVSRDIAALDRRLQPTSRLEEIQ